ncbi:MAG: prepilin-type N-terminal cleavage/methylation domain-containing protein [Clostridiales bacterium]|nr:prepilin-type N-terminal cleavage/methylation domain-containing protein [Clostridiales bacterium]
MMNKLLRKKLNKKGFTLIELIVVIAILGILAAIIIPRFTGFQNKARETQALVVAKQVATAVDSFYAENSAWPTDDDKDEIAKLSGVDEDNFEFEFEFKLRENGGISVTVETEGGEKYTAGRIKGESPVEAPDPNPPDPNPTESE